MAKKRVGFFGASGTNAGSGIRNALSVCAKVMPSVIPHRVISCNPVGGVAAVAREFGVAFYHFPFDENHRIAAWQRMWDECGLDYLVLLGCSIRVVGLQDKTGYIINEHPALLSTRDGAGPLFGGKGMTDLRVHQAVIAARQTFGSKTITKSGSTTHFVVCTNGTDDDYDAGGLIIAEHPIPLNSDETPESLQTAVKTVQRAHTPQDIEDVVSGRVRLLGDGPHNWRVKRGLPRYTSA